ncbi:MAG TPA: M13 family metallopeptidase N-terminal domain-containing protein, partial [Holophagaceae bacterium]|nr:M13 family metallopeptidase N-terminal domain-containing protein [Holophagaceae bacterium]
MKIRALPLLLPVLSLSAAAPTSSRAVDRSRIDFTADPCADFTAYAWGRWMKGAVIPADRTYIGVYSEMEERNDAILRAILQEAAARSVNAGDPRVTVPKADGLPPAAAADPLASIKWLVGTYYASGMDEAAIEKAGTRALAPELARIANVVDAGSFAAELARLQRFTSTNGAWTSSPGFLPMVAVDDKDSSRYLLALRQSGLGLPDRDYYFKDDADSKALRDAYQAHIAKTFELTGDPAEAAAARGKAVMELETRLAKGSSDPVALRDPLANYHKLDLAGLKRLSPSF